MPVTQTNPKTIADLTGAISGFAARLEGRCFWFLWTLAACIGFVAAAKARYRRLWLDEIMGLLIAKLPHASDIWNVVRTGADNQPAFYHLLTRTTIHLLRNDAWGLRMPSLAGYLLLCASLYWFVGRRTSRLYGVIAFLFPCVTGCWSFATEGRPYALVLGCTGLAAVCWQSIAMDRARKIMLAGLFFSLAGTLNLHYYSLLLFAPFVLAELVRTYERRRLDKPVWLALILPLFALTPYIAILRESRTKSGIPFAYYANPTWFGSIAEFVGQFLGPALVTLLIVGCIYLVWKTVTGRSIANTRELVSIDKRDLLPDFTLLLGFTLLPILAIAFSKFGTHIFFTRYIAGSMFGICGLAVVIMWLIFSGEKAPALLVVLVMSTLFARSSFFEVEEAFSLRRIPTDSALYYHIPEPALLGNLPIVAAGPNEFMDIRYYGDHNLNSRAVYVSSEEFANQYLGFTFLERMMLGAAPYFGTNVVDYRVFVAGHPTFYMLGGKNWWLVPKLLADGAKLELLQGGPADTHGNFFDDFFLVQMPGAAASGEKGAG